ncbi:5-formyltetrahydrofolate cyclo-ligase [Spirillospora sp. NBC_01491]|uniref:5-formyltetrahydrofolate cyclo-ligase n=1 Tax=Spirillospora sp. NBC_01491 TaxID=2976007 RepID=UPI002E3649E6|nr:5-formyltetrahydrofolate cyclo-ligase [Spirillospora sp. NBC_01491]
MGTDQGKDEARHRVWDLLEQENVVRERGVHGHIPDFIGSERATELLTSLPAWGSAQVIKANPDRAQLPVRTRALREGKLVYMAVPRLADEHPFYELDPGRLPVEAAMSKTAEAVAPKVMPSQMRPVDLILCGTVAVNHQGARLGKGAGYSDIEFALAQEAGLVGPDTIIVTTVHDLQVVDEHLPEDEHDFRVDVIVTPTEIIRCGPSHRPSALFWDHLDSKRIASIPFLAKHARTRCQHAASEGI